MASLYELTNDFQSLLEMLEDPDIDPGMIEEAMRNISGEFDEKAENYCKIIKELEGKALVFDKEIERLSKLKASCENNVSNLREILLRSMQLAGKDKIEGELFKLTVKRCAPKVIIDCEDQIPEEFLTKVETIKVDKKAIGAYLKDNPYETSTFAHLEENHSLMIK